MNDCVTAEDVLQPDLKLRLHVFTDEPGVVLHGCLQTVEQDTITVLLDDDDAQAYPQVPAAGMAVELSFPGTSCLYRTACAFLQAVLRPQCLWTLEKPFLLTREQHRGYVRVPVMLPVHIKTKNIYGTFNNAHETVSLDISGSGLCFTSQEPLAVPAAISLLIDDLPGLEHFPIMADTVRCAIAPTPTGSIYHIGVTFDKYLSTQARTALLRAITRLQQAALAKGVGIR